MQDQLPDAFLPGKGGRFFHQRSPDSLPLSVRFDRDLTDFPDAVGRLVRTNKKPRDDDLVFKNKELTILTLRFEIGSRISQTQRITQDPLTKIQPDGIRRITTATTGNPADIHDTGKGSMGVTELFETIETLLDHIEARGVAETH